MSKVKVLHVVVRMSMGGIEKWLTNVFETYNQDIFQMDVCCIGRHSDLGVLAEKAQSSGTQVHYISLHNPMRFFQKISELRSHYKYDVMLCHFPFLPVLVAGKLAGFPAVLEMYHNTLPKNRELFNVQNIFIALRWINVLLCKKVMGCSRTALDSFFPGWRSNNKFIPLYYGIPILEINKTLARNNIRSELGICSSSPIIGHIGRFAPQKNHVAFVNAAKETLALLPEAHFILVGDGPLRPKIQEMVNEMGLSKSFHFLGVRHDVFDIMCAIDIAYYPSLHEGSPVSFIEAQVMGLPIVTGQRPEMIEAICPTNNSVSNIDFENPRTVAKHMVSLLNNPNLMDEISRNGMEWAKKNFSIQKSTANLEEILISVTND